MSESEKKVAESLLKIKAIKLQPSEPFTWASGWKSPIYCDNRKTLSFPEIRTLVRDEFVKTVKAKYPQAEVIAGVATGAIAQGALVAQELGLPFIYGIEFDSEDAVGDDLHMLGYGFDPENEIFLDVVIEVIADRNKRNRQFMDALNTRGFGITEDDVKKINGGRYVGKPTFAKILIKKGIVSSVNEAFSTIFREPDLKAIKKVTMPSKKAVETIHAGGGLAVMAHPMEQRRRDESFEVFKPRMFHIIETMVSYGIDGLEWYHPSASEMQQELLVQYAKEHGLMITGGSDFHSLESRRDFDVYHRP